MTPKEKEQLEREIAMRAYAKRTALDRATSIASVDHKFAPDERLKTGYKSTVQVPLRNRQPKPVASHLGGEHQVLHRFPQGGNTVIVERPKLPANLSPSSLLRHRPAFEFENVARPAEAYFDIIRKDRLLDSLLLCKRLIKTAQRGGNLTELQQEYDDYLREMNLCPQCKRPVALHKSYAYPVIDAVTSEMFTCYHDVTCKTALQHRRKEVRILKTYQHKGEIVNVQKDTAVKYSALRGKTADKKIEDYADIPLHFDVVNLGGKLRYQLAGMPFPVGIVKREIKIILCPLGTGCKGKNCKGKHTTKTHYLERFVNESTGEDIISLPTHYRVIDDRCGCTKRYAQCGADVPNNVTLEHHEKRCKVCSKV